MLLTPLLLVSAIVSVMPAPIEPVDLDAALREALVAFVAEEIEDAKTPEMQQEMAECIYPIFEGIDDRMITEVLAEDDFERGLGIVLTAYPEREEIIERCEDLLR